MRCHYLSDLHLESETFETALPGGDVLVIAGDLCHARCLDPRRTDPYSTNQRGRVLRFVEHASARFAHVLLVAGNHEHYDGVFEETAAALRHSLPGVTVLDDETAVIGGVRFFGATLWTDFDGGSEAAMHAVRRRMGEFFFVKTASGGANSAFKFQPEHALRAHGASRAALLKAVGEAVDEPLVVITHHAPSRLGLNKALSGNGLDCAYASSLDSLVAGFENVPFWVHGHTHVAASYQIGDTRVLSNARGFASKGAAARGFSVAASFKV